MSGVGECRFSNSESGLVEQNIQMLKDLPRGRRACYAPNRLHGTQNPLVAWPLPLGLILVIGALLFLAPCLVQFLKQQITSISKIAAIQVLVQYQVVPNIEVDVYDHTKTKRERYGASKLVTGEPARGRVRSSHDETPEILV